MHGDTSGSFDIITEEISSLTTDDSRTCTVDAMESSSTHLDAKGVRVASSTEIVDREARAQRCGGRMRKPTQRWEPEESRYDPVFAAQRKRAKKLSLQQLKKQGKLGKATWRAKTRIADSPTSHSLAFLPLPCPAMPPAEFDLPEEWIRL